MSREDLKMDNKSSCCCPFCDEPVCPDPVDERFGCSNERILTIHRVDCVGLYCPVPVMRAKEEIDRLAKGNLMELVADDPAAAEDIPRWTKRTGHRLVKMIKDGEEIRFLIQKDGEEVQ